MTELLKTNLEAIFRSSSKGPVSVPYIENILKGHNLNVIISKTIGHDISAVTNNVFSANLLSDDGETRVIIKVSQDKTEPREHAIFSGGTRIGGWTQSKLENEARILGLLAESDIPSPKVVSYIKDSSGSEVFVEQQIEGKKCSDLRSPNVNPEEFAKMEVQKGVILAQINSIPLQVNSFGTLDGGAVRFSDWEAYFSTKVLTTLSYLYTMYQPLTSLKYFDNLAKSESEWKTFIENLALQFSKPAIQRLLENDNIPTLSHGDFWDGNLMAIKRGNIWEVSVIDFERGGIEGKSWDLAMWLIWKIGGKSENPDPVVSSEDFLRGYIQGGGTISPDIRKYISIYGLWQYLDFLVLDVLYGIDRTDESAHEIKKLTKELDKIR